MAPSRVVGDAVHRLMADARLKYNQPRRRVVERLAGEGRPMTADELRRAEPTLPYSSMYRTLTLLENAGVVERFPGADGIARFELTEAAAGPDSHHHHLVCDGCGSMEDIEVPPSVEAGLLVAAADVRLRSGFDVASHRLELVGRCRRCPRPGRDR